MSFWKFRSFTLGINFASEQHEILAEGMTYEMLNYDVPIETIKKREFYICLSLGFWQVSFGVRI